MVITYISLEPPVGKIVDCKREARNPQDQYAVALRKDSVTVGHVPNVISCICTLFLRRGGIIIRNVTGPRKYSDDLPQGGLELPCTYRFIGPENVTKKARQLFDEQHGVSELQGMFTITHFY